MGTASGVVAALVAAVFAVLVTAVRDQRDSTEAARRSQQVINAATQARQDVIAVDLGRRGNLKAAPDVQAARRELESILADRLPPLVAGDAAQTRRVAALAADPDDPARQRLLLDDVISTEQATVERRRDDADAKAKQAIALGIGGLIGSAALIALLTTYLTRYIVVPVRRTARAAHRLAEGDLSARVPEEGDAEPVELARAFNTMAVNLQEGERVKDEFFALVSHELRTPLTSIIGYLELVLDDEDLPEETRRFLQVVERNATRLLRLVGDMLFVAQVEAGRLSLESTTVDLGNIAAESVEAARPAAASAGVTLALESASVRPVFGDRDRLGQMLDNLVSNALKFTPEGGRVDVRLTDAGDHADAEVTDTGMGIPESEQHHLFERFFRSSSATSRAVPGAGLGLTIVKAIAEAHGGTVDLTSREGSGTSVRVSLPYERVAAAT